MNDMPQRGYRFVDIYCRIFCSEGATLLHMGKNIPVIMFYAEVGEHFLVFIPEGRLAMMLLLFAYILYHSVQLRPAMAERSITFLPSEFVCGEPFFIYPFG